MATRVTRKNINLESNLVLTISGQLGLVSQLDFFNKNVAGSNLENYFLIKKGEFAYNRSYSKGYPLGAIKQLELYDYGILSTLYILFQVKESTILPLFLKSYYCTNKWHSSISKLVTEGARNHGLLNISPSDFFKSNINLPMSLDEQKLISRTLELLDTYITLHQRKLENLKRLEELYLLAVFPHNNEKAPKIRFKYFQDDWQLCKFKNLLKEFSNKSTVENEYTLLSSTNNGMEKRTGRVSGKSNKGYKIIEHGDLVLSPQNLWLGNININSLSTGLVSPSYKTFKVVGIQTKFIEPQLKSKKMLYEYNLASIQGASVVRKNLDLGAFNEITIRVPSDDEQYKIAQLLLNLNRTITCLENKVDSLILLKRQYLDLLFI